MSIVTVLCSSAYLAAKLALWRGLAQQPLALFSLVINLAELVAYLAIRRKRLLRYQRNQVT